MNENQMTDALEERVLGHILSKEELAQVTGGEKPRTPVVTLPPVNCTPRSDGVG